MKYLDFFNKHKLNKKQTQSLSLLLKLGQICLTFLAYPLTSQKQIYSVVSWKHHPSFTCSYIGHTLGTFFYLVLYKVPIDLNVFRSIIMNKIVQDIYSYLVIIELFYWLTHCNP